MKLARIVLVACTLVLLTVVAKQAHAEWLVFRVTPQNPGADGRTLQVKVKDAPQAKEGQITVRFAANAVVPRKKAHGRLFLMPVKGTGEEVKLSRGVEVPVQEKWEKDRLTYTFRVPVEQLPRLRFEYWDGLTESAPALGGGTLFEVNVKDFLPAKS